MRHLPALLLSLSLFATGCSGTEPAGRVDTAESAVAADPDPSTATGEATAPPASAEPAVEAEPDPALLTYPAQIPAVGVTVAAVGPEGTVNAGGFVVGQDDGTVTAFPLALLEGRTDGLEAFAGEWRTRFGISHARLAPEEVDEGATGGFVTDEEPDAVPADYAVVEADGTSHVWSTDVGDGRGPLAALPSGHLVFVRRYTIAPDGTQVPLHSTSDSEGILCDFGFLAFGEDDFDVVVSTPEDALCLEPTIVDPQFGTPAAAFELARGGDRTRMHVTPEGIIDPATIPEPAPEPFEFGYFQPLSGLVDGEEVWVYEGADRGLLHDPTTDRMILGLEDGTIAAFDGASTSEPTELWVAGPFCQEAQLAESETIKGIRRMLLGDDGHLYAEVNCDDGRRAALDLVPIND